MSFVLKRTPLVSQLTDSVFTTRTCIVSPPTLHRFRRCVPRATDSDIEDDPLGQFCPVPRDQQPLQELKELQGILFFDWATLPFPEFLKRLLFVWTGFFIFISLPVSAVTFDPRAETLQYLIAGSCGSLFVVLVVVFRLFLGWSHVGDRLVSETVEYEESGWYDGQIWTKPKEFLDRDLIASSFTVRPALERLKTTLFTVSASFLTSLFILALLPAPQTPSTTIDGMYTRAPTMEMDDYLERAKKFEPWAFENEEEDSTRGVHY
eukprot:g5040.t1